MYLLHPAVDRGHQRGDGDLHGLTGVKLALIGVAVILREAHPRVVHELGDLLCADLVAHRELCGLKQLTGVGRRQRQRRNILVGRIELLLIALYVRLCLAHLFLRIGRIIGKERVARGDLLPLGHEDVAHGARGRKRDALALLRLDHTAAVDHRGNGAVVHNGGTDLRLTLLLSEFLKEGEADRKHQYGGNDTAHDLFALFPALRRRWSAARCAGRGRRFYGALRRRRLRDGFHRLFHVAVLPFPDLLCVIHFIQYNTGFLRSLCEMVTIWKQNVTISLCCF